MALGLGKGYAIEQWSWENRRLKMDNEKMNVKSQAFDQAYTYEGNDLGCCYTKDNTSLKVWAPTADLVQCHLVKADGEMLSNMVLEDRGVWSLSLDGDFEGASYVYRVHFGEHMNEATDPYAIASTANHERTVIIDKDKCQVDSLKEELSPLESYNDAIIYELHVRDFSVDPESGIDAKGKFLGLAQEGTKNSRGNISGLDYLVDLGVTHIQLLPVYDFASVDENNPFDTYNWGYDPVQYNLPEGSYGSDITDPYSRIIELKQTIRQLHAKGLRVIMDVVYNHMYDKETSAFDKIVPNYYFRSDDEGNLSNGSFCGNDIDSRRPMAKKFLLDSTRLWIEDYGFDGFRFDLMGILDIDTMNDIASQTLALDPSAMLYGEGWNMPTFLDDAKKASMMNHSKMPNIAYFSDIFREKIKGGTLDDKFHEGGFGTGDNSKLVDAMHLLLGTVMQVTHDDHHIEPFFYEPSQSVNYVECHDNHTLWDKLSLALPKENENHRKLRHRFITTMVLISQGIPFLHAGQEFFRSKKGDHNSYKSSDDINMFRWLQKDENQDNVNYVKDLIQVRKAYKELRLSSKSDIERYTSVEVLDGVIQYKIKAVKENQGFKELCIMINPKTEAIDMATYDHMKLIFNRNGGVDQEQVEGELIISPLAVQIYIV